MKPTEQWVGKRLGDDVRVTEHGHQEQTLSCTQEEAGHECEKWNDG